MVDLDLSTYGLKPKRNILWTSRIHRPMRGGQQCAGLRYEAHLPSMIFHGFPAVFSVFSPVLLSSGEWRER